MNKDHLLPNYTFTVPVYVHRRRIRPEMTVRFLVTKSRKVLTVILSLLTVPRRVIPMPGLTSDPRDGWPGFTKRLIKVIRKIGSSLAQR
jgi:hypothetical protein